VKVSAQTIAPVITTTLQSAAATILLPFIAIIAIPPF
jgi:hypothetical protein